MSVLLKDCLFEGKKSSLFLNNGKIINIGKVQKADQVIDCAGLSILPGMIDGHVHFREPGAEYKEGWVIGSRAAVSGGVTTVIDMPNTNPATIDSSSLEYKRKLVSLKSIINYGFHFGATKDNQDTARNIQGVAGIKIFVGSSTGNLLVDNPEDIKKHFQNSDKLFLVHAEDEKIIQQNILKYKNETDPSIHSKIRPGEAAEKAVKMILELAEETGARVHICHVSTKKELNLIRKAKEKKLPITCEAAPHHLFLTEKEYKTKGNFVKINPPLRKEEDRLALWQGIKNGIIDTIATDHAPHTKEEKAKDYRNAPSGVPGVETVLPLLLNEVNKGNLTMQKLIELVSINPAKILNLKYKGKIAVGMDADLVLADLNLEKEVKNKELQTKCGWSPYEGWKLKGWPVMTIVNGYIVYNRGVYFDKVKGREINYG